MVCQQLVFEEAGLFGGNFSSRRGIWKECEQVWCGSCYMPLDNHELPIARPMDKDGNICVVEEDKDRFVVARKGDNS